MKYVHSKRTVIRGVLIGITVAGLALVSCQKMSDPTSVGITSLGNGIAGKSASKDSIKAVNKAIKDSIKAANKAVKDSIKAASKNKTLVGQSVMIGISGPSTFLEQDSSLWDFRDDCAAPYYNIPGLDTDNIPFSDGLTPADKIATAAINNKCAFWNGGTLTDHNCNGVIISPLDYTTPVPAGKCWVQRPVYAGASAVTFNITLASQHVEVTKSKGSCDFSLNDSKGSQKTVSVTVTLIDSATGAVLQVDQPAVTLVKGDKKSNNCLEDIKYKGNGGSIGDAKGMLEDGGSINEISGDDDDKDNDGDKGCSKRAIYVVAPITYNLVVHDVYGTKTFIVQVTGTLKNSTGTVDQSFTGVRTLVIGKAPSCPLNTP